MEHFQRLCTQLRSLPNMARHYWTKLFKSDMPRYRSTILFSEPEVMSIRRPLRNPARRYIAGLDGLEEWDAEQMRRLWLEPQWLT